MAAQEFPRTSSNAWRLRGTVTDNAHTTLGWVRVKVIDSTGREVGHAETSSTGTYEIGGLDAGTYSIQLEGSFVVATQRVLTISPSAHAGDVQLDIVLHESEYHPHVVGTFVEPNILIRILYALGAPWRGMKRLLSRSR
jgi:hypothetical protein